MNHKQKGLWCCSECGHKQVQWAGQCPGCSRWNTLHHEIQVSTKDRFLPASLQQAKPIPLDQVASLEIARIATGIKEFDHLIGGGIVPGSFTLLGGDPGIGKSTLMLQIMHALIKKELKVLYVCGEESVEQTALRARRLGISHQTLLLLNETNFSSIRSHIEAEEPDIVVLDSIQIVYKPEIPSAPGSVSQVREVATEMMHLAKKRNMAAFLIGHVTKSGDLAGPRVLEHLVDTVLYFEGEQHQGYRMIRVVKNRFGPTDEVAVFQMQQSGLIEVPNPSQIFLEERRQKSAGSVIIPTVEGTRPILIEVQALVTETFFPSPSRRSTGIDQNRLALLLAVLEKRLGYPLYRQDVFVSIAGGIKVLEPSIDLGILVAIASSFRNQFIDVETIIVGEVGLGGELRSVSRVEQRLKEAYRMGFRKAVLPQKNIKTLPEKIHKVMSLKGVEVVEEAVQYLLG